MKIGINCGHTVSGQPGCGAVGYINESDETRAVGNPLMKLFSDNGHTVINCTDDYASSTSQNLQAIVSMANAQSLDLFVSIHFNSGGGQGTEVFTYGGKQLTEAVNVCNELNKLGFRNRGVKDGSSLYVVKNTVARAILIEVCFTDTKSDVDLYSKITAEGVAKAIYTAITGQSTNNTNTPSTPTNTGNADAAIEKIINLAIGEKGYIEKATNNTIYLYDKTANAGSNNYTKYGYEMHQLQPSNMDYPAAWCDAYVDWLFVTAFGEETARKLLHDFDDYTVNSANHFKKAGQWYTAPKKGDQIFFANSSGIYHTGLVIDVDSSKVYTSEGNTSDGNDVVDNGGKVCNKSYSLSNSKIAGYGRPDYSIIEEEIDMEELNKLIIRVDEIEKYINEKKSEWVYNYVDENMPSWAKEAVQWEIDNGIIKGVNEEGELDLTEKDLRQIVREYRFFNIIKNLIESK